MRDIGTQFAFLEIFSQLLLSELHWLSEKTWGVFPPLGSVFSISMARQHLLHQKVIWVLLCRYFVDVIKVPNQ